MLPASREDLAALAAARDQLFDLSGELSPQLVIARATAALLPGVDAYVHRWSDTGTTGEMAFTALPRVRRYDEYPSMARDAQRLAPKERTGRDPHQGRAVDLATAFGGDRDAAQLFRERILGPLGAHDQARVLVGNTRMGALGVGMFLSRRQLGMLPQALARLQAFTPDLHDAYLALRAIGGQIEGVEKIAQALSAFDEPAWLVSEAGRLLHRNDAAARVGSRAPTSVIAAARGCQKPDGYTRRVDLELSKARVALVLWQGARAERQGADLESAVTPALLQVAKLLAAGHDQREVARRLGKPVGTVRTYIARLSKRLGVRSRAHLIRVLETSDWPT